MFKTLKVLSLFIGLILLFSFSSEAVEKSNIDSIVSYVKSTTKGEYNGFKVFKTMGSGPVGIKTEITHLWSKENTAVQDRFDWTWTIHVLRIKHYSLRGTISLEILAKDYQDFVSPNSRGFTEWGLTDDDLDGKVDFAFRDYSVVACIDDDCTSNHILFVDYPKGFRNMDWYTPSEEEREERYNKEINYWMKTIWGVKK